ncbi:hypothetical protein ACFVUY_27385 [Kitasatospora sp. NPDC058063]|uniref:hypothetical protein n=1 Tax=unclassified Kitasatospora TaxID=2633591 RepID=UPI0036DB0246
MTNPREQLVNRTKLNHSASQLARDQDSGDMAAMQRRIRELQHENEILRAASHFFTRELDPRCGR